MDGAGVRLFSGTAQRLAKRARLAPRLQGAQPGPGARRLRTLAMHVCALLAGFGVGVLPVRAEAEPPRIELRGALSVELAASSRAGKLVVSVQVRDDAGEPVGDATVHLGFRSGGPDAAPVALSSSAPEPCSADSPAGARPAIVNAKDAAQESGAQAARLRTDALGRACVQLSLPRAHYRIEALASAPPRLDDARATLETDLVRTPVRLQFERAGRVLSLDEPGVPLRVIARGEDGAAADIAAVGDAGKADFAHLELALDDEEQRLLGTASTDETGRASFALDPLVWSTPGPGRLRVRFAGDARLAAAEATMPIERRARVSLSVSGEAGLVTLAPADPEQGVTVTFSASTRMGAAPSGSVELRTGDRVVAAAPVRDGSANLTFVLPAPATTSVALTARFVPDVPWYTAGPDLRLVLPIAPPSPWRSVPLLLAAIVVVALLVFARRPARLPAPIRKAAKRPEPAGVRAGIEVVSTSPRATGLSGRVFDAHDGHALSAVQVRIVRPSFDGERPIAATRTNASGEFVLGAGFTSGEAEHVDRLQEGDVLVIEAPFHSAIRREAPRAAELRVGLVARKRALLDRLVGWARSRGRPFDRAGEPTPGDIRRAAAEGGVPPEASRWAEAVERAAFGGDAIDAQREAEVDRLMPSPARSDGTDTKPQP
jgi:hypothetical protein